MATGRIGTTPVLTTRWSKQPAAGTTSLSGLDDNSVSLVYSVGYEAVYRNGTLLSRGNDYTATNGTTITLVDATLTGDIIEVFANQTIPLTDTYSQTVSDGRFIKNTLTTTTGDIIYASAANTPARLGIGSTDQVLKVSGGIPAWGAAPSPSFSGCAVWTSATSSWTQNVQATIAFPNEDIDAGGYHDNTTNNSRITIPTGKGGKYLVTAAAMTPDPWNGYGYLFLFKNGSSLNGIGLYNDGRFGSQVETDGVNQLVGSTIIDLVAGDYLELRISSAWTTGNHQLYARFTATYLGA